MAQVDGLLDAGRAVEGVWLFLGATDTGKTTLLAELAKRLVRERTVAVVDADVGQSHIGPPAAVGWARLSEEQSDPSAAEAQGIAFVGDVTPVGHLLQLAVAMAVCVQAAAAAAEVVLIDTPGFVAGPTASALWWSVVRLLRPDRVVAIRRGDELDAFLGGLPDDAAGVDLIEAPKGIAFKSAAQRRLHRQRRFEQYFRDAPVHAVDLDRVAVRTAGPAPAHAPIGRLVALADRRGNDLALGVVQTCQPDGRTLLIRAPALNPEDVRALVVGSRYEGEGNSDG
jgi:polynucleotide 5'-hydroxyl-kinase GRC3/NOL9